jgi:hypothetical protein
MVEAETVNVASPPSRILVGDTLILMLGVEKAGVGVGVGTGVGVGVGAGVGVGVRVAVGVEAGTV